MRSNDSWRDQVPAGLFLTSAFAVGLCMIACGPSVPRTESTTETPKPPTRSSQEVAAHSAHLQDAALAGQTVAVTKLL